MSTAPHYRFYRELAEWWPLISPPEEYAEETAWAVSQLEQARRPLHSVLELGSGGGHSASHMKARFDMTLVDLSEPMLEVSRRLNPECRHILGDMRDIRLDRRFDAVFIHDAIDYIHTEADLAAVFRTAWQHLEPGGILVAIPDHVREIYEDDEDVTGHDAADGRGIRLFEWTWDPDPADTSVNTEYVFLLRHSDGRMEHWHETHRLGLFACQDFLRLMEQSGFLARQDIEITSEDRTPRRVFLGHRPE